MNLSKAAKYVAFLLGHADFLRASGKIKEAAEVQAAAQRIKEYEELEIRETVARSVT